MFHNEENLQQQQAKVKLMLSTLLLVNIISQAGEAIDAYIRAHSEASHAEVLDGVSSILKVYGFDPTGEIINTETWSLTAKRITSGVADLPTSGKKGGRKRPPRGWRHQYIWLSFFPYWRSVLASRSPVKVFPGHVKDDPKHEWDLGPIYRSKIIAMDKVSSPTSNQDLGFSEAIPQPPGIYQPKRAFGTAAMRFLKVKKAYSSIPNHNVH
ncbi:hypothetical protein PR202_ga27215 [Eleusine coracana subsp. coracana]|uniref:Uncharacterized protein n=1 Tax=Eleusine coracana subsp. coracana TaxID=191504 RepID=A0AAV5DFB6_ELECO|nr:hypothetical protein PR202_ga27215 [Eleusine coracana subsp. coracana]